MTDLAQKQDKLYLALYVRDHYVPTLIAQDDRFHWALLLIPARALIPGSTKQATRFHIRNYHSGPNETRWIYEEIGVDAAGTPKLLTTVEIGDVLDLDGVLEALRDLPITRDEGTGWDCVKWIEEAVAILDGNDELVKRSVEHESWSLLRRKALANADAEQERRAPKNAKEPDVWELYS